MKKKAVRLSLAAVFTIMAVLMLSGTVAVPNDANMTLEAGKTYCFMNADKQNTYYITNNSENGAVSPDYDYVYKNDAGSVSSFGSSAGRITVMNGGSSIVTMSLIGDMDILYPSEHITITEVGVAALSRSNIEAGRTVEIVNKNQELTYTPSVDAILKTVSPKYDIVSKDTSGNVTRYASNESFLGASVPEGGSVIITAVDEDLRMTMPVEWLQSLQVKSVTHPALFDYTLKAGGTVSIANKEDYTYDLSIEAKTGSASPKYDFAHKDTSGKITSYGNSRIFKNLTVDPEGAVTITANQSQELTIWFPYEWRQEALTLTAQTDPALYFYTLKAGGTVEIANKDMENSFQIANNSGGLNTSPKFDYVYRDMNQKPMQFGTEDLFESFVVSYGGTAVITAKKGYDLRMWLPNEWMSSLSFVEANEPALYFIELPVSETLLIQNNDINNSYSPATNSYDQEYSPQLDYVYTDISGHVSEYGGGGLHSDFSVPAGGSVKVSANNGYQVKVWMPYEWTKVLTESRLHEPAIRSYVINPGRSMIFKNNDLDMTYSITSSCDDRDYSPKYDYVCKDSTGRVRAYGYDSQQTEFSVDRAGAIMITANESYKLKIWFPSEWLDSTITVEESSEQALYRYTLAPSKTVWFRNLDKQSNCSLSTDSSDEAGSAKYDYIIRDVSHISSFGSANLFESITIGKGGEVGITATNSYPLKIWFPLEWLDKAIGVEEGASPVLYTYVLEPDRTVEISNNNEFQAFQIFTSSGSDSHSPELDYVAKDKHNRVTDCVIGGYHKQFTVESGGSSVVTAGKDYALDLWIPNELMESSAISLEEVSHPAVYHTTIRPGQGLRIVNNNSNASYQLYTDADGSVSSAQFEYLYKDSAGKITSCGGGVSASRIIVENGGTSQITVTNGTDLKVWLPYEWTSADLSLTEGAFRTLYSYTLPAGQSVELVNSDNENAYSVFSNSTNYQGSPQFGFVYQNAKREIVGYGHGDIHSGFELLNGGRTVITAAKNFDMEIWYPAEWNTSAIKLNTSASPALYFYTLKTGKTVEITNRTDNTYAIQNDSGYSIASPKYDYQVKGADQEIESAKEGDIVIPPYETVEIKAVNGFDLMIWMPVEWEKNFNFRQ